MHFQILSFNIHKGIGWGKYRLAFPQLYSELINSNFDIIFLQEVRGTQFQMLKTELFPYFSYGKNAIYETGDHGNVILSKHEIIFSNNIDLSMHRFERRGLLHSIVNLPEHNQYLHLLCAHLGLRVNDRRKQLKIIVRYIEDNIKEHEPIIFGGDFNDWGGYATKPLITMLGFEEAFLTIRKSYAVTFPAWAPMLKLDRLYFRGFKVTTASRLIEKPWRHLSDHIALTASLNMIGTE